MKYEDYKVEDMVFSSKEDWTEEEMREFLDTCPECKDNEETVKALNDLKNAINLGVVKTNRYNEINGQSAKAYANRHDYIYYNNSDKYSTGLYVLIDGDRKGIDRSWTIDSIIKDLSNIERRFNCLAKKYRKKEEQLANCLSQKEYIDTNKEQIIISRMAGAWLSDFRLQIPTNVEVYRHSFENGLPYYTAEKKEFRGWDCVSNNKYDEVTFYGEPITEEEAKKIIEVIQEASRKVSMIIDRCKVEIQEIQEKHRKEV